MRVFLDAMTREPEAGRVRMWVRIGGEPVREYLGEVTPREEGDRFHFSTVEHELFMRLSDLAVKRFCNCTVYQLELGEIMEVYLEGGSLPPFPIELGTTEFGFPRPSAGKILWGRITRPVLLAWSWWKWRHVRRENRLKYEEKGEA